MDPDFWYLTGLETVYSILVVTPERTAVFVPDEHQFLGGQYPMADFEDFRYAQWNRPGAWKITPGPEGREISGIAEIYPLAEFDQRLDDILGDVSTVHLPIDPAELYSPPGLARPLTVPQQMVGAIAERVKDREIRDLNPVLTSLRLIKDEHEIAALRRAAEISAKGLVAAMRQVRPGMNDLEIAGLMEYVWKQEGSPRAAFEVIVKSGSKMQFFTITNEQYSAADRVMQDGELLFADYGAAEYMTYTSDLCRTFPVSGKFSDEQRKYYDIVDEARAAAIAAIRPGAMLLDAVKAAAEVFQQHGLQQYEDIEAMGADKVWGMMPSAEYMTYTSDLCRTFPVSGKFSDEQRKYYDIVDEARAAAIAAIRPGAMLLDAVKAAAEVFQQHGLQQYEDIEAMGADKVWGMMPSPTHYLTRDAGMVRGVRALGHFIGLEVADRSDTSRPLEAGMVFTVEPKIYIPEKNISIMIEDMVLVTDDGHEVLSAGVPTSSAEIERLMQDGRRNN